ncbi:uncharacterized protein METZ01_LOCUS191086, partial [marine metagenome]
VFLILTAHESSDISLILKFMHIKPASRHTLNPNIFRNTQK